MRGLATRTRALIFLATIALLPLPAGAVSDYGQCVDMATIDPEKTLVEARRWEEATGAVGALHCRAIALGELGAHRTAASTLMDVANSAGLEDGARVETLIEASRQYRLAGMESASRSTLDSAIRIRATPAALVERAALRAEDRDWEGARGDLDAAIAAEPRDAEALALRSAARLHLGDLDGARRDATLAIEYRPVSAMAWYQLGLTEQAMGLKDAARRSWLKAIDVAPGGEPAALARGALQDMDGG